MYIYLHNVFSYFYFTYTYLHPSGLCCLHSLVEAKSKIEINPLLSR